LPALVLSDKRLSVPTPNRSSDARLEALEAWRPKVDDATSKAAAAIKDLQADVSKNTDAIIDHERQLARLERLVESSAKQLDNLAAQVDSIHKRLDRHEEYHEGTQRSLVNVGIELHKASEERKATKLELKDLIIERVVPRIAVPTSVEAEGLRAKLAGLEQQLAAVERERDQLRQDLESKAG
jgi:chromosome segregation ATPase